VSKLEMFSCQAFFNAECAEVFAKDAEEDSLCVPLRVPQRPLRLRTFEVRLLFEVLTQTLNRWAIIIPPLVRTRPGTFLCGADPNA